MYHSYYRRTPANKRLDMEKFAGVLGMLSENRHTYSRIALQALIKEARVSNIASFFGFSTGSPVAKSRMEKLMLEKNDPALFEKYREMRVVGKMPIVHAAKKAGISDFLAKKWDRRIMTPEQARILEKRIGQPSHRHPHRPLIREFIKIRNPDKTYRYPLSYIARAFGADPKLVKNINDQAPRIRSAQKNMQTLQSDRKRTDEQRRELMEEAMQGAAHEIEKNRREKTSPASTR